MIRMENEDTSTKLTTERENYDQLLRDKMLIEEQLRRKQEELKEDTAEVE